MVGMTIELTLAGLTRVVKCDTCVFAGRFECKQIHGAGILPAAGPLGVFGVRDDGHRGQR